MARMVTGSVAEIIAPNLTVSAKEKIEARWGKGLGDATTYMLTIVPFEFIICGPTLKLFSQLHNSQKKGWWVTRGVTPHSYSS